MAAIKVENLSYSYPGIEPDQTVKVFENLDLEIEQGSFVAILGSNGSGKSTLAKHFNAILLPNGGKCHVYGMDTSDEELLIAVRRSVGMVFQNPDNQIIGSLVEEDVAFGPENLGIPTDEIWARVDRCLKAVNMEAFRESSPNRLSGGQKQRVAIAGVMAMEPDCIILDEPTAMLDPKGRQDVISTIYELNRTKGITIILITHNMDEVIDADRVFVMDKGSVIMNDGPREVFQRVEELKSCGLEIPFATELAYQLRQEGINLPADILTREELVEALCQLN